MAMLTKNRELKLAEGWRLPRESMQEAQLETATEGTLSSPRFRVTRPHGYRASLEGQKAQVIRRGKG